MRACYALPKSFTNSASVRCDDSCLELALAAAVVRGATRCGRRSTAAVQPADLGASGISASRSACDRATRQLRRSVRNARAAVPCAALVGFWRSGQKRGAPPGVVVGCGGSRGCRAWRCAGAQQLPVRALRRGVCRRAFREPASTSLAVRARGRRRAGQNVLHLSASCFQARTAIPQAPRNRASQAVPASRDQMPAPRPDLPLARPRFAEFFTNSEARCAAFWS